MHDKTCDICKEYIGRLELGKWKIIHKSRQALNTFLGLRPVKVVSITIYNEHLNLLDLNRRKSQCLLVSLISRLSQRGIRKKVLNIKSQLNKFIG